MQMAGNRMLDRMSSVATVGRAFGEPLERDGSVLIPVARVTSGGGGGEGDDGSGGGFGLRVTGSGVFVIRNGEVSWQPALDVTRIALGGQIVAIVALLVLWSVLRARAKARRAEAAPPEAAAQDGAADGLRAQTLR
jgi:uncharacterized spore protein YtfJ